MAALRPDIERSLLAFAFAGLCLGFGVLAGLDPRLAIGGALAIAFFGIAMANLTAGLVIFALIAFFSITPGAVGSFVSAQAASLVLALSWLARMATQAMPGRLFWSRHPAITWLALAFLAWVGLSSLWAENAGDTVAVLVKYGFDALLFVIVFEAIRTPQQVKALLGALVAGGAVAAAYGIIAAPNLSGLSGSPTAATDLDRLGGTIADPNLLAAVLVVAFVLAVALTTTTRSPALRFVLIGAAGLALLSVFLTASRGGAVGLLAALVTAIVLAQGRRPAAIGGALAVVAVGAIYVGVFDPGVAQRYSTTDGGNGRTDLWKVGWRMAEANLVKGVGGGNFRDSSAHYVLTEPGAIANTEFIIDQPRFAHNIYLEILAELGVIGLALFLALIAAAIGTGVQAGSRFARDGNAQMALLSRAVVVSLVALLAMDFFLSDQFSKQLWLLLALCPAMLSIATKDASAQEAWTAPALSARAGA